MRRVPVLFAATFGVVLAAAVLSACYCRSIASGCSEQPNDVHVVGGPESDHDYVVLACLFGTLALVVFLLKGTIELLRYIASKRAGRFWDWIAEHVHWDWD